MMKTRTKTVLTLVMLVLSQGVWSQVSTPASGGKATGTAGTVSYSIAQTFYNVSESEQGSITEGIQQPFEISVIDGINYQGVDLKMEVYPNPTTDYLILSVVNANQVSFGELYNASGAQVWKANIQNNETRIEMANLKQGAYFLKVYHQNQALKAFKIIKY